MGGRGRVCGVLLALAVVSGCASLPGSPPIRFSDESYAAGVADPGVNSTGPTFADFDNDGDIDLYVSTEAQLPGHGSRLYQNDGGGRFRDVAPALGADNGQTGIARGASWGDYDNDGDQDLLQANVLSSTRAEPVPTILYRNQLVETGRPGFLNVTRAAGLMRLGNDGDARAGGLGDTPGGVAWADYDNDGDLDVYWKNADYEIDNALFRNEGNGTFTDVTASSGAGIQDKVGESNSQGSPSWTDVDQDGWVDLLVTNEGDRKVLLRNRGDGTFEDITRAKAPPNGIPFLNAGNANGACVGDVDNDGDQDVFLPTADQANRLILSRLAETGTVTFEDVTLKSGVGDKLGARGCTMADFDNDGWLDIYVNNGGLSDTLVNDVLDLPPSVQFYIAWDPAPNKLYRNRGDGTFEDVTEGSGAEGMGIGSGVGWADVNDDGFPDLFVANRTYYNQGRQVGEPGQNRLYVNRGTQNGWIRVLLQGSASNRDGYGARVKVVAGDLVQTREHTSAHGYNSGNDPRLLFGLGNRPGVDRIEVTWPGGATQVLPGAPSGTTLRIVEPTTSRTPGSDAP